MKRIPLPWQKKSWLWATLIGGLVLALGFGLYATWGGDGSLDFDSDIQQGIVLQSGPVDQTHYTNARRLAALAATVQEKQYATQALRNADHELDRNFSQSIGQAALARETLTGAALQISQRIDKLRVALKQDELEAAQSSALQPPVELGPVLTDDAVAARRRLAQAQVALDNDELDNLQIELERLGASPSESIQHDFDQHRAIEAQADELPPSETAELESLQSLLSIFGKARAWLSLMSRTAYIREAQDSATEAMKTLTAKKETIDQKIAAGGDQLSRPLTYTDRMADLANIRDLSGLQKDSSDYGRRISDLRQLNAVYAEWDKLLTAQRRMLVNRILRAFLILVLVLAGAFVATDLVRRFVRKWEVQHQQRLQHSRIAITVVLHFIAAIICLITVFGLPSQTSTIIGLTTAGITIALKDFIVSFLGWFTLMGHEGFHIGDSVEIDGVQGEVIEITPFRTVVLETGTGATEGHPTGRRVTWMNKFAIEGKFFNFSTSGQWQWDEIVIAIPAGSGPNEATMTRVRDYVTKETLSDASRAEKDWRAISESHGVTEFNTKPAMDLLPSPTGVDLVVRYITSARNRFYMRGHLHRHILPLLQNQ